MFALSYLTLFFLHIVCMMFCRMNVNTANVKESEQYYLLKSMVENIWNFYFAFDFVQVMGRLNSKLQSHSSTVIDAEIELRRSEDSLHDINTHSLPNDISMIINEMDEKESKDHTVEELKYEKLALTEVLSL